MKEIIIITGKQGSGKTTLVKKMSQELSTRKPYERELTPAYILNTEDIILKENVVKEVLKSKDSIIIDTQKGEFLPKIISLILDLHLDFSIIDLDSKKLI